MDKSFIDQIDPIGSSPTEHQVKLVLGDMSLGQLSSFCGKLVGPYSEYAKTLPATFSIHPCEGLPDISNMTQQIITDPCYWTPQSPYLYRFEGEMKLADGTEQSWSHTVGFKRWEVEGSNLRLERRRTVLRGAIAADEATVDLQKAHEAEVALLVECPSDSFLQQASEYGVMVIADLRSVETPLTPHLLRLAWQPSVALVIISPSTEFGFYEPCAITLGYILDANIPPTPESESHEWAKVLLVELDPGERPPSWMAETNKPVIAIRRGLADCDFEQARSACDRLQSDLAPQFNLAGYFVSP